MNDFLPEFILQKDTKEFADYLNLIVNAKD